MQKSLTKDEANADVRGNGLEQVQETLDAWYFKPGRNSQKMRIMC